MATSKKTTKKTGAKKQRDHRALLSAKTRPTMDFPVSTDTVLADTRDEAKERLDLIKERVDRANKLSARLSGEVAERAEPSIDLLEELEEAQEAYDKALAVATEAEIPFVLQAMPRPQLINLYKKYPPTDAQKKKFRDEMKALNQPITKPLDVNEEVLPPHLIFHCMKEPEVTHDEVLGWWYGPECEDCEGPEGPGCDECEGGRRPDLSVWSRAELEGLFLACSAVNNRIK